MAFGDSIGGEDSAILGAQKEKKRAALTLIATKTIPQIQFLNLLLPPASRRLVGRHRPK
jgi:hypothetical protein